MDLCQDSKPMFDWFESDWNWRGLVACDATGEHGPLGKFGVAKRHQMDAEQKNLHDDNITIHNNTHIKHICFMSHDIAESRLNDIHEVYNPHLEKNQGVQTYIPLSKLVFPLCAFSAHGTVPRTSSRPASRGYQSPPTKWAARSQWLGSPPWLGIPSGKIDITWFNGKYPMFHGKKYIFTHAKVFANKVSNNGWMSECPNTHVFFPLGFKLPKGKPFGWPFTTVRIRSHHLLPEHEVRSISNSVGLPHWQFSSQDLRNPWFLVVCWELESYMIESI